MNLIETSLNDKIFNSFEYFKDSNVDFHFLFSSIESCKSCLARKEARRPVPPEFRGSRILFVGRNPGIQEDINGIPFYPKAPGGRIFQEYLSALGLSRDDVNVSNAIFCHTFQDRPPLPEELLTCSFWKYLEFKFLYSDVEFIFPLGNDAYKIFVNQAKSVIFDMGKVQVIPLFGKPRVLIPLHHPGFVMRNPFFKRKTFLWLESFKVLVDSHGWNSLYENFLSKCQIYI